MWLTAKKSTKYATLESYVLYSCNRYSGFLISHLQSVGAETTAWLFLCWETNVCFQFQPFWGRKIQNSGEHVSCLSHFYDRRTLPSVLVWCTLYDVATYHFSFYVTFSFFLSTNGWKSSSCHFLPRVNCYSWQVDHFCALGLKQVFFVFCPLVFFKDDSFAWNFGPF